MYRNGTECIGFSLIVRSELGLIFQQGQVILLEDDWIIIINIIIVIIKKKLGVEMKL